jgi:hypothetical protein
MLESEIVICRMREAWPESQTPRLMGDGVEGVGKGEVPRGCATLTVLG